MVGNANEQALEGAIEQVYAFQRYLALFLS